MARYIIFVLLLAGAAVTVSTTKGGDTSATCVPNVTASLHCGKLVRVICGKKGDESNKITTIELQDSRRSVPVPVANVQNDRPIEAMRLNWSDDDVAVHGFIDNNNYAFLEISFFERPAVKTSHDDYRCQVTTIDDQQPSEEKVTLEFQEVDVFSCSLSQEAPASDVQNIVIIEKNGEHENVVGPSKTSASEVNHGMKQFGEMKNASARQPVTVYMRSNSSLTVARLARVCSNKSASFVCQITTQTCKAENFTFPSPSSQPEGESVLAVSAQQIKEEEISFVWLGYPVLSLLLIVFVVLYVRERRLGWRACRQNELVGIRLLETNSAENP